MRSKINLTLTVVSMAVLVAMMGLISPGLYRDNGFVKAAWYGNDWITLIIVTPAMLATLYFMKRGVIKARLIWLGLLLYYLYNYAFYLFGAAFNPLFLIYVGIFSLSLGTLVFGLVDLPVHRFKPVSKSLHFVSVYLVLIAIMLFLVEAIPAIEYIFFEKVPLIMELTEHPTNIVFALDLSVVMPLSLLAAILLWRMTIWGMILATMALVKGIFYGLVLVVSTWYIWYNNGESDPLIPFYLFVVLGGMWGLWWTMKHTEVLSEEASIRQESGN